jgi:hypothetical protein
MVVSLRLDPNEAKHAARFAADAIVSRDPGSREFALRRPGAAGVDIVTTEMAADGRDGGGSQAISEFTALDDRL